MIKKLLLGFCLLIPSFLFSQHYEYGAAFASNVFVKCAGSFEITDTTVTLSAPGQASSFYTVVKKANNLIYFTDGVMTHYIAIAKSSGKKKGYAYTLNIVMTFDKRMSNEVIMYYANEVKE